MEALVNIAQQYGPLGLVILALFFYVIYRDKAHEKEREKIREQQDKERIEMMAQFSKQHSEALEVTKNNNEVTRNNTSVLSEIATLIKNRNVK